MVAVRGRCAYGRKSGHYTANVYRARSWWRCDDGRVQKIEAAQALDPKAYMLVYEHE